MPESVHHQTRRTSLKRQHAHLDEYKDKEEIPRKRLTKEEDLNEYVLLFALFGYVTPREDTWIVVLQST